MKVCLWRLAIDRRGKRWPPSTSWSRELAIATVPPLSPLSERDDDDPPISSEKSKTLLYLWGLNIQFQNIRGCFENQVKLKGYNCNIFTLLNNRAQHAFKLDLPILPGTENQNRNLTRKYRFGSRLKYIYLSIYIKICSSHSCCATS